MSIRRIFGSIIFTTWLCAGSLAQNTDSLLNAYQKDKGGYNFDSLLIKSKTIMFSNPDKSFELLEKIIAAAKKQKNPLYLADSYRTLGNYYSDVKADFPAASTHYRTADSLYRKIKKSEKAAEGMGAIYHCYAVIQQRKSNYPGAIELYTKALRVFDSIQNNTIRPKTLNNLSTLYSFLKDHVKAEKYARECLKISQENNDNYLISATSNTLASTLIQQGKYDEVPSLLDNAEKIAQSRQDYYILDLVHLNYGGYYHFHKKDYQKAIKHYSKCVFYAQKLGNDYELLRGLSNLSESYWLNAQISQARETALKAYTLAKKIGATDIQMRLLGLLAEIEAHEQNFEKAYRYSHQSSQLKDTIFNEKNQQSINYLETKYQTEKKELRISSLEKEKKLYGIITLVGVLSLLLFILSIFLRYKAAKRKKQIAEQKILQLEQEKQLIATQAVLEGETAERTRLARDLHDGLGGMLSAVKLNLFDMKQGVIVEAEDVSRFNKVMDMLDNSMQELRRVAHNMMPESLSRYGLRISLEDFCGSFPNVKFHFFGTEQRFDTKIETTVYRAAHELVNNAVKYAQAESINVQLVQETDRISITVQDDGQGFDPQENRQGSGLQNIENRVNAVNGKMNVFSQPGQGTEITVEINLNRVESGKN